MASLVETNVTVPISSRWARNGGIDLHALAVAYLAVLKAATGRDIDAPLTDGSTIDRTSAQFVRFRRDEKGHLIAPEKHDHPPAYPPIPMPAYSEELEETDDAANIPDTLQRYVWGDDQFGLRTFNMGARSGRTWWTFVGLPANRVVRGESDLNMYRAANAELILAGPPAWKTKLAGVFEQALAPWDQRREPDGLARLAIETALSDRLRPGGYGPWENVKTTELEEARAASDPHSPAGMAVRFYLAVVRAGCGKIDEAAALLDELPAVTRQLRFSHGISLRFEHGRLLTVDWHDDFPGSKQAKEIAKLRKLLNG